ncbi:hypothetical protein PanWU01x14_277640 [Parasponia andersonii]|uniref:Transmembrane protein n=1 Tax=Parasponia andersonii TaxID=3476 RepID=A0A2P5B2H9_PARAD|nr:hypothetical protein PanWU01x14_277640 [Parasponia andersonii]
MNFKELEIAWSQLDSFSSNLTDQAAVMIMMMTRSTNQGSNFALRDKSDFNVVHHDLLLSSLSVSLCLCLSLSLSIYIYIYIFLHERRFSDSPVMASISFS